MTPETLLANQIKLYCGQHNWLCFHCVNGTFYDYSGKIVKLSFPVGWPDLLIVTDFGKCMFIETKIHPRRPTNEQVKCQENLVQRGFVSATVYSLEEFKKVCEKL